MLNPNADNRSPASSTTSSNSSPVPITMRAGARPLCLRRQVPQRGSQYDDAGKGHGSPGQSPVERDSPTGREPRSDQWQIAKLLGKLLERPAQIPLGSFLVTPGPVPGPHQLRRLHPGDNAVGQAVVTVLCGLHSPILTGLVALRDEYM